MMINAEMNVGCMIVFSCSSLKKQLSRYEIYVIG